MADWDSDPRAVEYAQDQWRILNEAVDDRSELVKQYNQGIGTLKESEKWMEQSSHVAGKDYINDKMKHPNMIRRDLVRMEHEIERLNKVIEDVHTNLRLLQSNEFRSSLNRQNS